MSIEMDAGSVGEERVLIHAPFGRDAQVIRDVLAEAGMTGLVSANAAQLCDQIAAGAGAAIIAVDAMACDGLGQLAVTLAAQPPWSDLPLIVLFQGDLAASQRLLLENLADLGNLNLLERPLRIDALLNAVTLALRARRRQYQTRTQMRQLEEVKEGLARARNLAVRANEAKSRFLAAASHDLRQPFQAMRLYHQIIADALDGEPAVTAAARLGEAITSGEDLLNALLDLSTLEAGITKVDIRDSALDDILETIVNDLGAVAAAKGLTLRVRSRPVIVHSDPVLLKRILRNLVMNAISYTERGGVLIGCRIRPTHVLVQVYDTGIGIAADKLGQIFEDFYQIGNLERDRSKGIGLGLSIVDRMACLLDHPVSVRSMPGRGSCFTVKVARAR